MLHPRLPIVRRFPEEVAAQRLQGFLHRIPPGEDEVQTAGQREGHAVQVRDRGIGGQSKLAVIPEPGHMIRAEHTLRTILGPPQHGIAENADARRSRKWLDDPNEFGGSEASRVTHEARGEVENAQRSTVGVEARLENVGILQVSLCPRNRGRRTDRKPSAFRVEERAEHRRRVETREAAPDDGPVSAHVGRDLAIPDEAEVGEGRGGHGA